MRLIKRCVFKGVCICAAFIMLSSLCACTPGPTVLGGDILTQKKQDNGRTQISVLVKYAFSINTFETEAEEKFPDIDIVQVGNYTRDMGIAEYESRLKNDDLTDIVMTWPLDVGEEYWGDRLLDLSGFDFTSDYNLSMLNDISRDGKLYYLPGPSQVRGIIYNKTLFQENEWKVPSDFEEFISLCKTIEESGVRSLQLGLGNSEVLDTAFVGYSYGSCFSQPQDTQWLKNYNDGTGSFGAHFMPALDTFQRLVDERILQESDLDITYADREFMLYNRECAMVEDSVLMARMAKTNSSFGDDFALMPFYTPDNGGDWARLYAVCYVGLNKHLAEPKNKEKYDKALKLMEYISSQEGQEALMGDTGAMFSSLTGMPPPAVEEIADLVPALTAGRYGTFPQLKNAQQALREGLADILRQKSTAEDVVGLVDAQNRNPQQEIEVPVIGKARADFSLIQTGSFITDCMREASGSDLALFLDNGKDGTYNGKGVSGSLYEGDITETDINRILPDLKRGESGTLWTVAMTGADLLRTLEYSISLDNNAGGWFYYFSGLTMEYDPTAAPGERIGKITMEDGTPIDGTKIYSIAVMDESVPEEFLKSCEKSEITIAEILTTAVSSADTIAPPDDDRFLVIQK